MARRFESTDNALAAFAKRYDSIDYSPKTKKFYFEQAKRAIRFLPNSVTIYTATADDVKQAVAAMRMHGLAVSTTKDYLCALIQFFRFIGNTNAASAKIIHQVDTRPKVDWLTPDQAKTLINAPMTPQQQIAIILSLGMGLRRIEIIRLKMTDVNLERRYVSVTGKGRGGGKLRIVPFHPRLNAALGEWLTMRHKLIKNTYAPDNLLIWARGNHVYAYSDAKGTGIDGLIKRLSSHTGFNFSFHTLRRTFGRLMWLSGVPVATIAQMLGHRSTEQTLRYIGANMDDMNAAMSAYSLQ